MAATRFLLDESAIPTHWYNVVADLGHAPSAHLGPDGKPVGREALAAIFPPGLIAQEVSAERWIEIPEPVREIYKLWRPTPLHRAHRLEAALKTPARIYYKYEGVSPAGSHKLNTAVAQAYYNVEAGIRRVTTETGAGQWGSSMALAGQMFGLDVRVFMVKISYGQKPYRRSMMRTWGAEVFASPSTLTHAGRAALAADPDGNGSLGLAISEAVEEAASRPDTNYTLGSVLNHVVLHQSVIGLEAKRQMERADDFPDAVFGCCGGGSNFGGIAFPFLAEKRAGRDLRLVAVEPDSCPTLTRGHYAYDFGDSAQLTPMMRMYTLGHDFSPPGIHAGGLRYHGASPLVSQLHHEGLVDAVAVPQLRTFAAGVQFARTEGIIPAPESCHAIAACLDEALRCRESGESKCLLLNLSGHGHFDMTSYDRYLAGELEDFAYPEEAIRQTLARLPQVTA
jgi:tryptophan synthase beta chain